MHCNILKVFWSIITKRLPVTVERKIFLNSEFTALYEKYKKPIFSYVYYLAGDWRTAEEISQDVFLKVYLNINKFEGRSSFKTWIYRIAKNTYLDYTNAKSTKLLDKSEALDNNLVDGGLGPEDYTLNNELKEKIHKILSLLNDKYRMLLILRDVQHLSYNEISEVTGQDLNKVKVGIYRARQAFRKIYEEMEGKDVGMRV
jgi:RNA polymerase sigma-70 factor (ECF subfamily)